MGDDDDDEYDDEYDNEDQYDEKNNEQGQSQDTLEISAVEATIAMTSQDLTTITSGPPQR